MRGRPGVVAANVALLFLASCGDQLRSSLVGQVGTRLVPALAGSGPSAEEAAAQAAAMGFGPDAIAANPENYMLFQVGGLGIAGLGRVVSEHDNLRTWLGDSGYSVSIENGLVVATRGFGKDLMAADVASVRAAIDAGGGEAIWRAIHPAQHALSIARVPGNPLPLQPGQIPGWQTLYPR